MQVKLIIMCTLGCFANLKEIMCKARNPREWMQVYGQETSGILER